MNRTLVIAQREYLATVRTKGFLIGLIAVPILMFGGLLFMMLFQGHVDTRDKRVAVLDRSGALGEALRQAAERRNDEEIMDSENQTKIKAAYQIELVPPSPGDLPAQRLALSERVRQGALHAFVEIGPDIVSGRADGGEAWLRYHSKSAATDDVRGWLAGPINERLRKVRLAELGIPEQEMNRLFHWVNAEPMELVKTDAVTGEIQGAERSNEIKAVVTPLVLVVVMYLMSLMAALPMLNAVMEEKSQRIAEVLLGAARPLELMAGKLVAGLGVAMTGALVYVCLGVLTGAHLAALAVIPWHVLPWFFAFLLLGILLSGAVCAGLGAVCSDPKDAQNLMFPAMLPMILPMFMLVPVLKEPQSALATGLSFVPPFTPMLMVLRIGMPAGVPGWQPWLGLLGMLLFTLLCVWIAARVFRVGILIQGQSPTLRKLLRWAIRG